MRFISGVIIIVVRREDVQIFVDWLTKTYELSLPRGFEAGNDWWFCD